MKTHINFATIDLARSVAFYETLLDAKPTKVLPDYALFITQNPGLELALDARDAVDVGSGAHYGVYVESADDVAHALSRLSAAGLAASIEREETCCYAKQTKVWAIDPDGRRWEIYTVHEDTEVKSDEHTSCCADDASERSCCAA